MDKILKQFGKENIEKIVKESNSFIDVTIKLGLNRNGNNRKNVERSIKRLGISTDHFDSVKRLKDSKNRYTKEKLEYLVKKCKTYSDILKELDILPITNNFNTLKKKLNEYNIDYYHLKKEKLINPNYEKEKLESVIKKSLSFCDVFRELNLSTSTYSYNIIKRYIKLYNIDISHFDPYNKYRNKRISEKSIPLEKILVINSTYSTKDLKKRLYKTGIKKIECELCGQDENWKGKRMSLILDHKNGINDDNRLENLQIVCPNCNATLPTHCRGKNKMDKINQKKELKKGNIINKFVSRRKVSRPSYEQLKKEIKIFGYLKTGRKYGVSDNAIRKWVNFYEKYERH